MEYLGVLVAWSLRAALVALATPVAVAVAVAGAVGIAAISVAVGASGLRQQRRRRIAVVDGAVAPVRMGSVHC